MSLKNNALITIDEFISSINLNREDLKSACFKIYNSSSDATAATIVKNANTLTLTVTGGVNAHTNSYSLVSNAYDTIGELVTTIEALGKGWVINQLCADSFNSSDLYNIQSSNVLLLTNELTLNGYNSLALEEIINSVSAYIENYCRRVFIATDYTEYYDGTGTQNLLLKQYPVNSVTSVILWDYQSQTELETLTNHTDYELYANEGIIYKSSNWQKGAKWYKITYNAGYSSSNMPEDLKQGCKELCKLLWILKDKQGLAGDNDGVRNTNYDKSLGISIPANILAMLNYYIKIDNGY